MEFKQLLGQLVRRQDLDSHQIMAAMDHVLAGEYSEAQIGALLAALAVKGESVVELTGAVRAMRRRAMRIQPVEQVVVDTCGTGGDGGSTFNVSTTTALVVAGAGVAVAKHGNRAVSSTCGSADVLEKLGFNLDVAPEAMERALNEIGVAFLFAPKYHAAMRHAAGVRKQLGIRTLFNLMGPMANPAGATCQLVGVYAPALTEMFAQTLQALGSRRAFVVHGHDGLDEISVCAPTRVSEVCDGVVKTYDLSAERFFGGPADPEDLKGGPPDVNADIMRAVLSGEKGPRRNIVLVNAAAALVAARRAPDIGAGVEVAAAAIDNGHARAKLDALIRFANENG